MADKPHPFPLKVKSADLPSDLMPRLLVMGVGGAGCNAVDNMIRSNLQGVDFIACNTDAQALSETLADRRIQLGPTITKGLGAGSQEHVGKAAAEESIDEIREMMRDHNMVFVTAGMGGGTGTGASPIIAKVARDMGILTIGVVTRPFNFEGPRRARAAKNGIEALEKVVDTMIVIPNQNLFLVADNSTTFVEAFNMADDVLYTAVRGVTDLIVLPGLVNLDFADIQVIMKETGQAMMGTGEVEGEDRASRAAEAAISNPLLESSSIKGAKGLLINITGGSDLMLNEVDEVANLIRAEVPSDCFTIFGSALDENLNGKIRVYVVATGMNLQGTEHEREQSARKDSAAPSTTQNIPPSHDNAAVSDKSLMGEVAAEEPPSPDSSDGDSSDDFSAEADLVEQTELSLSDQPTAEISDVSTVSESNADQPPPPEEDLSKLEIPSLFKRIAEAEAAEKAQQDTLPPTSQPQSSQYQPSQLQPESTVSSTDATSMASFLPHQPAADAGPQTSALPPAPAKMGKRETDEPDWNKLIPIASDPSENAPEPKRSSRSDGSSSQRSATTPAAEAPSETAAHPQTTTDPFLLSARESMTRDMQLPNTDKPSKGLFGKISRFFNSGN